MLRIDNLCLIIILADKLPVKLRNSKNNWFNIRTIYAYLLLFSFTLFVSLTNPIITFDLGNLFSARDILMLGSRLFMLLKAIMELNVRLEGKYKQSSKQRK